MTPTLRSGNGNGYDATVTLTLSGEDGLLQGEELRIRLGESVVVGRSRRCGMSTRGSRAFLTATEEEQRLILANRSFLRVSRRHVRITFLSASYVEVWDLSQNGTFVNEKRVDRLLMGLEEERAVQIRLADSEHLLLSRT